MTNTIFSHKSIRNYKNTPIPTQILDEILSGAIRGSNTGNMQLYSIIITKNKEQKQQLYEAHFKQQMVSQAPIVLTFVADINRFHKWCELRNAEISYDNFLWFYNATIDATIAAQNASIIAENNGLGICYLGTTTYMAEKIIEILDLPKGVMPVTSLVVGYPEKKTQLTPRLPKKAVVFSEKYTPLNDIEIIKNYEKIENSEQTKKEIKQYYPDAQNLAQTFTKYRYKKNDNRHFSNKFIKILKKQGFMNQ